MATIDTDNFKLKMVIDSCDFAEAMRGNPYNTAATLEVFSYGFYGSTELELSYIAFENFVSKLKEMHKTLKGKAELVELGYGSKLHIECDNKGYFQFSGVLVDSRFQQFTFGASIDQTYVQGFVAQLTAEAKNCRFKQ